MDRNFLFLIIGVLIVVVAGLGYKFYQQKQQQKPSGIEMTIDKNGVSVDRH